MFAVLRVNTVDVKSVSFVSPKICYLKRVISASINCHIMFAVLRVNKYCF